MEKGQLFLTFQFQLINAEGIMQIENHHLLNNTEIVAGRNHQWMLKLVSQNMTRNRILGSSPCISSQDI